VTVMIGVDPHKGSHTAVAVDHSERSLAELRVRSGPKQLEQLLEWAEQFPERKWAVENATGLGYLLTQQLVAAGERVLDVQPKLAARVRLLATESTNKHDPHDALSVAIAALRSSTPKQVGVEDHAAVMRLWSRRHRNLSSTRTQIACRLHAVLCDLVRRRSRRDLCRESACCSRRSNPTARWPPPASSSPATWSTICAASTARSPSRRSGSSRWSPPRAPPSSTSCGVGPVVAATVSASPVTSPRFPTRDRFAAFNGTAPIEVSSGGRKVWRLSRRGNHTLNHAIHMAAVTQVRWAHSPGRGY
jgi:transposase